ncbi:hypothetical protein [Streptomyces sp. ME01-18h]|uniref:hypothetical protein n=1 Tax=Streptomyces sp. ME01-18h TaxID=462920 RepID=UPI0029A5D5FB|nr:hypothetical protein [Streptomyces sp. ME01-18h]MDX3398430.1 hypothetical protein [Streptomyces sp. ME01-18h]
MVTRAADKVRALLSLLGPLGAGSRALLLRLAARLGWKGTLAALVVAGYTVARYRTAFAWLLAAWCVAAWMHAPDRKEQTAAEAGEQPPVEAPDDPLPGLLWDLIGEAPGVHVKGIVEHLHETGQDPTCQPADVRAALGRRGIPLRASVRDAAGRVNQGVHRADLTAWEQALSPTVPAPLSKTRSNPATTSLTSGVADAATAVATPPTPAD